MEPHELIKGRPVVHINNRGRQGSLTGLSRKLGIQINAEVVWGGGLRQFEDIEFLEAVHLGDGGDPLIDLIRQKRFGRIEDARLCMTFQKLQGTLSDVFYSMSTAQLKFYPHQFKPVLRFVDSPFNRILVADEVGLGKTIEAGLIWLESQARYDARRLLVVCPNNLRDKWETELREKFAIAAKKEDASDLLEHYDEFKRQGAGYGFCSICNYQKLWPTPAERENLSHAFEQDELTPGLEGEMTSNAGRLLARVSTQSDEANFVDLVIFDEAHVMRNAAKATYLSGSILSRYSSAVVCLSATPVHNKAKDLYSLLRIVDPDMFDSEVMFNKLRELNAPVVALQNALTNTKSSIEDIRLAVASLDVLKQALPQSEILNRLQRIGEQFDGNYDAAAEMFNLAERLNLLGAFLCRTRKKQVEKAGRIQRRSRTLKVLLTPEEQRLYAAVLQFIRHKAIRQDGQVSSFHLIGPAMRMASSLPVLYELIRHRDFGGIQPAYDEMEYSAETDELAPWLGNTDLAQLHEEVESLADYNFEAHDSKYLALCEWLRELAMSEKVIIFAFFKDTLNYLSRRLSAEGFMVLLLTGDTAAEERTGLVESFKDGATQILLASEVLAEGVDLQFCRTIVNYDMPWNPMRVEQRIGRVDRIGQTSNFINIINFFVPGTIDGHIYRHLLNKLQIFETTIGDLEAVIGETVDTLTKELLTQDLTKEEMVRKIRDAQTALSTSRETERKLEESNASLIAHKDYLADNVGLSHRLGRYVQPEEIKQYLSIFFNGIESGCSLYWDTPTLGCGKIVLSSSTYRSLRDFIDQSGIRILSGVDRQMVFALTPEVFAKNRGRWRQMFLMNHFHPLVRWITSNMQKTSQELHPLSAIEYRADHEAVGNYFYLIRRVVLKGLYSREHLMFGLMDVNRKEFITGKNAEELLNHALRRGKSIPVGSMVPVGEGHLEALRSHMDGRCGRLKEDYVGEMQIKASARKAQVAAHFDRKISATQRRIETMKSAHASRQRGLELSARQIASLERKRDEQIAKIECAGRSELTFSEVTCGYLQVLEGNQ